MKKILLLTLAFAATMFVSAKQYCQEPVTQADNTIHLPANCVETIEVTLPE